MKVYLLDEGRAALAQALVNGSKLDIVQYRVGTKAGFSEADCTSSAFTDSIYGINKPWNSGDASPGLTVPEYVGTGSDVRAQIVSTDQAQYVLTIPANEPRGTLPNGNPITNIDIGNILLYVHDPQSSDPNASLKAFLLAVLPIPVPKYAAAPPASIGEELQFTITAKYSNLSTAVTINITPPVSASLPIYANEFDLPPAYSTPYQQAFLQNVTTLGRPALVARRAADNTWFGFSFFQRLDDESYGNVDGGVIGDGHVPFIGRIINGGRFETPPEFYISAQDGGGPNANGVGHQWSVSDNNNFNLDGGIWG